MVGGLVVTHGGLGEELVRVVSLVLGPVEDLGAVSNRGRSAKDVTAAIREWIAARADGGAGGVIVFIDDFGGSCANAAQLAIHDGPPAAILTGVNLAMVLDFLTWRDTLAVPELARRLVEKGRQAISLLGPASSD
jgi:PTS system mannose-specific IIA component